MTINRQADTPVGQGPSPEPRRHAMKKYRVVYRPYERADDSAAKSEEHYADGWHTDPENVYLYERHNGEEVHVFDIPKSRFMRIHEVV